MHWSFRRSRRARREGVKVRDKRAVRRYPLPDRNVTRDLDSDADAGDASGSGEDCLEDWIRVRAVGEGFPPLLQASRREDDNDFVRKGECPDGLRSIISDLGLSVEDFNEMV